MKKIVLFLLLLYSVTTVAQKTDATMVTSATTIKNATAPGSLTPTIIGNMFLDIVKNKSNKIYGGSTSGTNNYTLAVSDGVTSYVYGQWFILGFPNASTGPVTFNYNGAGALPIKNDAGTQLNSGDLTSGVIKLIVYNGSYFQVVGGSGGGGGSGTVTSITATTPLTGGTITTSGSIGINQSNGSTDGYLSSVDWNTFNGKQSAISFGTNVLTALGINVGSSGSFVTNGGALGTPSSGVATNLTGTAPGLTAGNVTTNANLNGDVVSSGNTTTYSGTVPINKGGSGQTTANDALNAFLPSQSSANGKVLQSNGTDASWVTPSAGFANPMTTLGDIIYGDASGVGTRLAGSAGFLKSTGAAAPTWSSLVSGDIPNNAANTSGTAANLSGTPVLPNGTTATTQSPGDNSTKLATTAYANAAITAAALPAADATHDGYLTQTDWSTFNGKISANQTISWSPTGDVTGSTTGSTTLAPVLAIGAGKITNTMIAASTIDLTTKVTGVLPVANGGTGTGTAFTVGSVKYATTSGVDAQDNANFFYDATNKYLGIGTASPLSRATFETDGLAVTQTLTSGITLRNGTVALVGTQTQISNALRFSGNVWNTTSGSTNVSDFLLYSQSIPGATPSNYLSFSYSINGSALGEVARMTSLGTLLVSTVTNYNSGSTLESLLQGSAAAGYRVRYASTQAGDVSTFEVKTPTQYASGTHTYNGILIDPDYLNDTGGTNHFRVGIRHKPTIGTVIGNHGFFVDEDTNSKNGLAGVTSPTEALEIGGNLKSNHIIGRTSAPTVAAGTGAGTSPTVTIVAGSTDLAGIVSVVTGTTPSGTNAIIATITFNSSYGTAPKVILLPANRNANGLIGVNQVLVPAAGETNGVTTTTFVIESNTTALSSATTYLFSYHIIQ